MATGEVKCIDDEIPFEIPDNWCWARLGNVVLVNPRNRAEDSLEAGYIPMAYIDGGYVNNFRFDTRKWGEVKTGLTHLSDGDIAFAKITPCFQNRKSMILSGLPNGIAGGTTELNVLRTYGDTMSKEYLLYFIKTHYFIGEASFKGTAGQQRVRTGYTENKLIPVPPISEQHRIAQKVVEVMPVTEKYELSKENLDHLNTTINSLLQKSILQEAIQGKLVSQNPEDEPASILLQRIRDEKLRLVKEGKLKKKDAVDRIIFKGDDNKYFEKKGKDIICIDDEIPFEIPSTWEWMRLSGVCQITNGFTPLRAEEIYWCNGTINWFTVEDLREQGEYIYYTRQKITNEATSKERIVREGSTLLCCTASIGQCALSKIPLTTNQQFNALTVKQEYQSILKDEFLFLFAKTLEDELHKLSGKTTFEFVSVKKVGNILIPIPPLSEQARIVNITNNALASIMSK